MELRPGKYFRLLLDEEMRARLHEDGWAGSERGAVEQVEAERVRVRFRDGQPWQFRHSEFETMCIRDDDDGPT